MKKTYTATDAHEKVRFSWYLKFRGISVCLLFILLFQPIAPLFAMDGEGEDTVFGSSEESQISELVMEEETVDEPKSTENALDDDIIQKSIVSDTNNTLSDIDSEQMTDSDADEVTEDASLTESNDVGIEGVSIEQGAAISESLGGVAESEVLTDTVQIIEGDTLPSDENEGETLAPTEDIAEEDLLLHSSSSPLTDLLVEDVDSLEKAVDLVESPMDILANNVLESEKASSTETAEEGVQVSSNIAVNDQNHFAFSDQECVTVGNDVFYCTKASDKKTPIGTDRIFSAKDATGDKEIFIEKNGDTVTLTDNTYDDDAPYYDDLSNTAVWHRLLDGRYQIIVYDFDTGEETQLTFDRYNNMQPSRFGDVLVWQGWVGNDWEIFLSVDNELTMLTDNTTHDIAPSVNGTHIVWQAFENEAWRMKVYDIRTGSIDTIEDAEGGSIQNPRFVLVYDTKFESGDIETRGYDLKSGEVVRLASEPVSLPEEIPDPDQTGEERALVTTVTQLKQKIDDDSDDDVPLDTDLDTDIQSGDIVIPPLVGSVSTTTATTTMSSEGESTIDTGEADIVVPLYSKDEDTVTDHIEDIIVTPYVEPITTTTESQSAIVFES